jgi:hypothetical protein
MRVVYCISSGVHFGCIIMLLMQCFLAFTLMIFYFQPPLSLQCYDALLSAFLSSSDCKFFIAGTFVDLHILWLRDASKIYPCQAALIERRLEQQFAGIMHVHLTRNDLQYNAVEPAGSSCNYSESLLDPSQD